MKNFEILDLSPIFRAGTAVHCDTEEKAKTLIENFIYQYPDLSSGWMESETYWHEYSKYTAYSLFLTSSSNEISHLMIGDIYDFDMENYKIIKFEELREITDSDIDESDKDIGFLLG